MKPLNEWLHDRIKEERCFGMPLDDPQIDEQIKEMTVPELVNYLSDYLWAKEQEREGDE